MTTSTRAVITLCAVLGALTLSVFGAGSSVSSLPPGCTAADRESVRLDTDRFTIKSPLEICDVPLKGWNVLFPLASNANKASSGIALKESKAVIGGKEVPTLVITCEKGTYNRSKVGQPVIELPMEFDASEWNILSFIAKVETYPEDLEPKGFGMDWPRYGLDTSFYAKWIDCFGVAIQDSHFDWAGNSVPTTYFPYHHVRRDDKGIDGFKSFQWDMAHDDIACNKRPVLGDIKKLRFYYDTRKLCEKEKVTITIADIRLVKGAETKPDDPKRYNEWKEWVKNYKPNYSDSSEYLLPPKTGRLANPIPLVKDGKPLAEIVVDLSEKVKINQWVAKEFRHTDYRAAVGTEWDVAAEAARELQYWTEKITGAKLPVLTQPSGEKRPRIFIGASFAARHFKADLKKLGEAEAIDGYAVREKNGDIYIFGATPNGSRNGVFAFLENNTDWIYAFHLAREKDCDKDDDGAVYTEKSDLTAVWGDAIDIPVFIARGFSRAEPIFLARLRNNYFWYPSGGHILSPQYYDHSEGAKAFNPILFNQYRKWEKWAEYSSLVCPNEKDWDEYNREWTGNKRYNQSLRFAYSDGLDDNYGYCNCPRCLAPFTGKDGRLITQKDFNEFWSSWLFRHYNKLADERVKTWPGYESGGFCYFMSAPKPAIEVSKNYSRPWLCTYVRKSQCVPIFAPINQHWWKMERDWAEHSPNCQLYDYYLLFAKIHPFAEVLRFDLRAMRDIHYLRIMSEDCGEDEYMGLADERWCVSRLYWNPDADVEELHRYFNRRVYHEAAPYIDKFRGAIRTAWYQRFKQDVEFEGRDVRNMINHYGMDAELRGYLKEAYKAAKNPRSKYLVARMAQSYIRYMNDSYMNEGKYIYPDTIDGIPAKPTRDYRKAAAANKDANSDLIEEQRRAIDLCDKYAGEGRAKETARQLLNIRYDRRLGQADTFYRSRYKTYTVQKFNTLIENNPNLTLKESIAFIDTVSYDPIDEEIGWMTNEGHRNRAHYLTADTLARYYIRHGKNTGEKLIDHYTQIDLKGNPAWNVQNADLRVAYHKAIEKHLAQKARTEGQTNSTLQKQIDTNRQNLEKAIQNRNDALRRHMQNALTRQEKAAAERRLMDIEWETLTTIEKIDRINNLISNKWIANQTRREIAAKIPQIYTQDGQTDWYTASKHILHAIRLGDWSGKSENTTRVNSAQDHRLDYVIDMAKQMRKAGKTSTALKTLYAAADLLNYKTGYEKIEAITTTPSQYLQRLERLNKAIKELDGIPR